MAIRLLSETTANRIAAGEVVERPAAVVKELVENALDAGASRIAVTLEGGGIERIIVEDDGSGMGPADLDLAVERHATSKLPEEAMLFRIATLGFRGEALPSIGAVARLTITSRPVGGDAHALTVEGGRKGAVTPAAGAPGTRIEMRDLFYAVPARRKFLKTPRWEAEAAVEAVRRLALAWLRLPRAERGARGAVPAAAGPRCPHPCPARHRFRRGRLACGGRGRRAAALGPRGTAGLYAGDRHRAASGGQSPARPRPAAAHRAAGRLSRPDDGRAAPGRRPVP
jgi:hypothetical protein